MKNKYELVSCFIHYKKHELHSDVNELDIFNHLFNISKGTVHNQFKMWMYYQSHLFGKSQYLDELEKSYNNVIKKELIQIKEEVEYILNR